MLVEKYTLFTLLFSNFNVEFTFFPTQKGSAQKLFSGHSLFILLISKKSPTQVLYIFFEAKNVNESPTWEECHSALYGDPRDLTFFMRTKIYNTDEIGRLLLVIIH